MFHPGRRGRGTALPSFSPQRLPAASRAAFEHRGTRSLILWLLAFTLTLLAMFGCQPLGLAIPGIAIACALISRQIDVTRIGLVMLIVVGSAFVINAAMVKGPWHPVRSASELGSQLTGQLKRLGSVVNSCRAFSGHFP